MGGLIAYWVQLTSLSTVTKYYTIPYLLANHWIVMLTYVRAPLRHLGNVGIDSFALAAPHRPNYAPLPKGCVDLRTWCYHHS